MAILEERKAISIEQLEEKNKNQRILSNRELMRQNLSRLIENLSECEDFIKSVIEGTQAKDNAVARSINQCLSKFTAEDMETLEAMMLTNFKDAMLTSNLAKLQMA